MKIVLAALTLTIILHCGCAENPKSKNNKPREETMTERYTPVNWAHSTSIYEVNLRQYTPEGSFNAFAAHLPRLREMGVETLWFMPVTPISKKNKKGTLGSYYACSDYTSVNPEFGTMDDFRNLVREAHSQGFKVIIDWVANHTGWDHKWTVEHPGYYLRDSTTKDFLIASGMDDIIELDFSNPELRNAMKEAMAFWVRETGIDGFRCDLAFWVELDFWKEARKELDRIKPLLWFGEFDELEKPEYGEVFDASYSWSWMHATKKFVQENAPLDELQVLLKKYDDLGDNTMRAWFTTNHDENSWNGTEYEKYGGLAKGLAVFSFTWNGIPLIYSGQEIGNRKRIEFFEKDLIQPGPDKVELQDFYTRLLKLKSNTPALRAGDPSVQTFQIKPVVDHPVLAYKRQKGNSEVIVMINMSSRMNKVIIPPGHDGKYVHVFSDQPVEIAGEYQLSLPPWGYIVLKK